MKNRKHNLLPYEMIVRAFAGGTPSFNPIPGT